MTYRALDNSYEFPEIAALARYLDIDAQDIERSSYDDNILEAEGCEYLV